MNFPFRYQAMLLAVILFVVGCNGNSHSEDLVMKTSIKNSSLVDGQLLSCPGSPNCVSSEGSQGRSHVAPLAFTGPAPRAWQDLQEVIVAMGGHIEEVDDHFLRATFRSSLFRFVDDLICRLDDENHSIHIRSAARVGYFDFGVNRKRVEEVRTRFSTKLSP